MCSRAPSAVAVVLLAVAGLCVDAVDGVTVAAGLVERAAHVARALGLLCGQLCI